MLNLGALYPEHPKRLKLCAYNLRASRKCVFEQGVYSTTVTWDSVVCCGGYGGNRDHPDKEIMLVSRINVGHGCNSREWETIP